MESKALGEEDGVGESGLLGVGEIKGLGTWGVERESTLGEVTESVRSLRVVSLHGPLAIRGVGIGVRDRTKNLLGPEG